MAAPLGWIGLGAMGGPMAGNLADKGNEVTCFDAAGTQGRAHPKATCAGSTAQVAAACETVFLSLPDGPAVAAVLDEIIAAPDRRTKLVVDTSTIGIDWARRNAARAAEAGIEYLDAPVSGGAIGAQRGTIAIMCAGSQETVERLRPKLLDFGKHVFRVGDEPGQAQAMKVLNNFLSATAMAATSEAIAFGEGVGLDMKTMLDVINVSSGQNTATRDKFPQRVVTESYDAGFRVDQFNKDLGLFQEAQESSGAPRPVSPAVIELWSRLGKVKEKEDMTLVYPFVRDRGFEA